MKTVKLLLLLLITAFIACKDHNSITGKYKMDGIGTVDTANGQGNITGYAMLSMMSSGAEFDFGNDGKFTVAAGGKTYASGTYTLSEEGKTVSMTDGTTEEKYEITKSDAGLSLKSVKDGSVLNLKKQ